MMKKNIDKLKDLINKCNDDKSTIELYIFENELTKKQKEEEEEKKEKIDKKIETIKILIKEKEKEEKKEKIQKNTKK